MEPEQFQLVIQKPCQYKSLSDNDTLVFDKYKNSISKQIREAFPSIPADFELKPVRVLIIQGCGTFYNYKVALPDNQFAKVSFHSGGMCIPPPGVENYQPPDPTFTVDEVLTSTADE